MKKIEFPELLKMVKESRLDIRKTKIICGDKKTCPAGLARGCSFYKRTYRVFDLIEHFKFAGRNKSSSFKKIIIHENKIYLNIECTVDNHPHTLTIDADMSIQYQLNLFERER